MFDMFKDNEELVAAILAHAEISASGAPYSRLAAVRVYFDYLNKIKEVRQEHIDELKKKMSELPGELN